MSGTSTEIAEAQREVASAFEGDPDRGVELWCKRCADAVVRSDLDLCEGLGALTLPFPPHVAALVADRWRPALAAWRSGQRSQAMERWTFGFGSVPARTGEVVRLLVTVESPGRPDAWRETASRALQGIWLEAFGLKAAAADAYVDASHDAGEFLQPREGEAARGTAPELHGDEFLHEEPAAIHLLTRACDLDPDHPLAHWRLADAWRIQAYASGAPQADRAALEKSLAAWNRSLAARLPDASSSWAYTLRAWIAEEFARLDDARRVACWWEAVLYLERAIVLDGRDATRWATLGRCHRLLGNERNSLHATAKAAGLSPDDPSVLEERGAILADTGAFDEAKAAIDRRIASRGGEYMGGVLAYIVAHQAQGMDLPAAAEGYKAARALIDEVIAAEPPNIWNFDLKATCSWMLGDAAAAREVYEAILRFDGAPKGLSNDDQRAWAFAAYRLGKYDEAVGVLQGLAADPLISDDVMRLLGLCYWAQGKVKQGEDLILTRVTGANARTLRDFLVWELPSPDLALGVPDLRVPAASRQRIAEIVSALAAQAERKLPGTPAAACQELEDLLRGAEPLSLPDPGETAVQAGVARLLLEDGRFRDPAAAYARLRDSGVSFPEADDGLTAVLEKIRSGAGGPSGDDPDASLARLREALDLASRFGSGGHMRRAHRELGEALWRRGEGAEAERQFSAGLLAPGATAADQAAAHARAGFVQLLTGQTDAARASFAAALQGLSVPVGDAGAALPDACRPLLRSVSDFWTLDADWEAWARDATLDEATKPALARARDSLMTYLDEVFQLATPLSGESSSPYVTPIALEVGSAILPLVDPASDRSQDGKFINVDIAKMRERIQSATGIKNLPGIRVRPQAETTDGYAILLDEVSVAAGTVRSGSLFVVEAADPAPASSFPPAGSVDAKDPLTERRGRWLSPAEAMSETEFILAHVEAVLRRHLDEFFGWDDTKALLTELEKTGGHAAIVSSLLNDPTALSVLTLAIREFLREGAPATDFATIVAALEHADLTSVGDTLRAIRLAVAAKLSGNGQGVTRVPVPGEWERAGDGTTATARLRASPVEAHRRLVEARGMLHDRLGPVALVAEAAQLRPLVRRLIECEFPSVTTLSRNEVLDREGAASVERTIASAPKPEPALHDG